MINKGSALIASFLLIGISVVVFFVFANTISSSFLKNTGEKQLDAFEKVRRFDIEEGIIKDGIGYFIITFQGSVSKDLLKNLKFFIKAGNKTYIINYSRCINCEDISVISGTVLLQFNLTDLKLNESVEIINPSGLTKEHIIIKVENKVENEVGFENYCYSCISCTELLRNISENLEEYEETIEIFVNNDLPVNSEDLVNWTCIFLSNIDFKNKVIFNLNNKTISLNSNYSFVLNNVSGIKIYNGIIDGYGLKTLNSQIYLENITFRGKEGIYARDTDLFLNRIIIDNILQLTTVEGGIKIRLKNVKIKGSSDRIIYASDLDKYLVLDIEDSNLSNSRYIIFTDEYVRNVLVNIKNSNISGLVIGVSKNGTVNIEKSNITKVSEFYIYNANLNIKDSSINADSDSYLFIYDSKICLDNILVKGPFESFIYNTEGIIKESLFKVGNLELWNSNLTIIGSEIHNSDFLSLENSNVSIYNSKISGEAVLLFNSFFKTLDSIIEGVVVVRDNSYSLFINNLFKNDHDYNIVIYYGGLSKVINSSLESEHIGSIFVGESGTLRLINSTIESTTYGIILRAYYYLAEAHLEGSKICNVMYSVFGQEYVFLSCSIENENTLINVYVPNHECYIYKVCED